MSAGPEWRPDHRMKDTWNRQAEVNAVSAVCYHATPEQFEESGRQSASYLRKVIAASLLAKQRKVSALTVLDLGGGMGRIAKYLAPLVGEYLLLDVSTVMLEKAKERMPEAVAAGRVKLLESDGYSLKGVPDRSIDFAFSTICFQHMDREVAVSYLQELRRVMNLRAWAWLEFLPMGYPERFEDIARGDWPANLRRWQPGELLEVCVRCGFSVVAAKPDGLYLLLEQPAGEMIWPAW